MMLLHAKTDSSAFLSTDNRSDNEDITSWEANGKRWTSRETFWSSRSAPYENVFTSNAVTLNDASVTSKWNAVNLTSDVASLWNFVNATSDTALCTDRSAIGQISLSVILATIILITIGGNLLVCVTIRTNRRLQNPTNCFVFSLASTDLLLGAIVLPFSALNTVCSTWPLGAIFCNIYVSCDVMLCTVSILTLFAISLDRYFAVQVCVCSAANVLKKCTGTTKYIQIACEYKIR